MTIIDELFVKAANGRYLVIATPYSGQVDLYRKEMLDISRKLGCDFADLSEVISVDAFQPRDARMVILDMVLSSTKTVSDLGFLASTERMTVLLTRAHEFFLVVGKGDIVQEAQY